MPTILTTWRPSLRNVTFSEKPDWVPDWVYTEAMVAKRTYNVSWEFWVSDVARQHNCSQADAEVACIRGLKTAIDRLTYVYGSKIGKWYEEFLDMKDLFTKVKLPEYQEVRLENETK